MPDERKDGVSGGIKHGGRDGSAERRVWALWGPQPSSSSVAGASSLQSHPTLSLQTTASMMRGGLMTPPLLPRLCAYKVHSSHFATFYKSVVVGRVIVGRPAVPPSSSKPRSSVEAQDLALVPTTAKQMMVYEMDYCNVFGLLFPSERW